MSKSKKTVIREAESPVATPTEATSKAMMMANIVNGMAKMTPLDLTYLHNAAMDLIGKEASSIPNDAAAKNLASVNSSDAIKEDINEIFPGEALSEDMKEKAATLFEAAVNARVIEKEGAIEQRYEDRLNEEVDKINDTLLGQVDQYLTYVAEQWMKQNKVAVDQSIRTTLAEDFISGLHRLVSEHYVTIPEDRVDVVEALSVKVQELEEKLNVQINENIEKSEKLKTYEKEEAIQEVSEGLAMTQIDKLKKLSEGVDFGADIETYKKKLRVIRENYFKSNSGKRKSEMIVESGSTGNVPSSGIDALAQYIANSVKN